MLLNDRNIPTTAPINVEEASMIFGILVLDVLSIILNIIEEEIVSKMKGMNKKMEIEGFIIVKDTRANPMVKCSMKNANIWDFLNLFFNSFLVWICFILYARIEWNATNPKSGRMNKEVLIGIIFSTNDGKISKNSIEINIPAEKLNNLGLYFFVNLTNRPLAKWSSVKINANINPSIINYSLEKFLYKLCFLYTECFYIM